MKFKDTEEYYELYLAIVKTDEVTRKMTNTVSNRKPLYGFCDSFYSDDMTNWLIIKIIFCGKYHKQTTEYCNEIFRKLLFEKIVNISISRIPPKAESNDATNWRHHSLELADLGKEDVMQVFKDRCSGPV